MLYVTSYMMMLSKFLKLRFDLIFFYIFVFLLPLEKKHVFVDNFHNLFSGYLSQEAIQIYLTDILWGIVLVFWLIYAVKTQSAKLKAQNHNSKLKINKIFSILLGCFFVISFASLLLKGLDLLELYHLTKLLEYISIFFYIIINIDNLVKLLYTIIALILSSFFQAILGIGQYLFQHSFGLKILGEVDLSPQIQNVAKIVVNGEKYILAYGTLPHSNILGGYLFIGLILCLFVILGLLLIKIVPRGTIDRIFNFSRFAGSGKARQFLPLRGIWQSGTIFPAPRDHAQRDNQFLNSKLIKLINKYYQLLASVLLFIFSAIFIGFILTFSRSAWLAAIISNVIFIILCIKMFHVEQWQNATKNVPRGTFLKFWRNLDKIWPIIALIIVVLITLITFFPQIKAKTVQFDQYGDKAISGRAEYTQIALKMIKKSPIIGKGNGNFVNNLADYSDKSLQWWQYQPVHNVFLLIFAETGIFGLILAIIFISKIVHRLIHNQLSTENFAYTLFTNNLLTALLGFFIIMLFDHYLWDIQQGALLFWLILGISVAWINNKDFELLKK